MDPLPEYRARKGDGTMDAEDFRRVVSHAITASVQFVDGELSVERAKATDYYLGKPFGNEEEGRSQAVLTEVADTVDGMLPSLMRVTFPLGEHAVEFMPTRADTVAEAEQKTDYVRFVFEQECDGFMRTHDVYKDGLIRKLGAFKWGWDSSIDTKAYKQEGISREDLTALAADDDVELTNTKKRKPTKEQKVAFTQAAAQFAQNPQGQPPVLEEFYDVEFTRTTKGGRPRVWSVPPEEFFFNREARSLDEALLVGHRTFKTRGELLAMGIDEDTIEEHGQVGDATLKNNAEEIARRERISVSGMSDDPEAGKANDKILYCEAFMLLDYDGNGIAELRRICTIGSSYYPVKNDPTDERPFAIFTPIPEPHTLVGRSYADKTMDVQKINSFLLRGMFDSFSASIFPRTVYLEGQASVADIMNTAIGAPVRERTLNAVRTLAMPFVGKEAMPILGFMQEVIERRTGRNKGAAGLDADALQSTGAEAVGAVLTGSQEQLEMTARVFCEMTLKKVFRGLGRLLAAHQPRERMVQLRGKWTPVNPKLWNADMDVTCNVGLGTSFTDKKIATLMSVAADQKDILTNMGIGNPLVTLPMFRNTRAKILALQGFKDVDNYYAPLPPDWQPPAPPPTPPDPEQMWIQAEKEMNHKKVMQELAIKADELKLEREKAEWDHEFQLQKLAADVATKKYVADAANQTSLTEAEMAHNIELERAEAELAMQGQAQLHDQHIARDKHEHDKSMAEKEAQKPTGDA